MKVKVTDEFKYKGENLKPGDTADLPDDVAKSVLEKGYGKEVEPEGAGEVEELGSIEGTEGGSITDSQSERFLALCNKLGWSEEKKEEYLDKRYGVKNVNQLSEASASGAIEDLARRANEGEKAGPAKSEPEGISKKLNNLLHEKYQELWGESYEVPKKELMKKMFGKEHTNELTEKESDEWVSELDRRINQRDIEEKAESEVVSGQGGGQVLKQRTGQRGEGVSMDEARKRAEMMGSPQMVKDLINSMDFAELGQYVWDPEEDRNLPYDDLEPKVSLFELVHPLWEMYTGWSYDIDDFEFNKNEEDDVYECKVTIIRKGGPSDPTKISFTKTKKKENLMNQRDLNRGVEKEQWKEFMQSLAYKRAMRTQMRIWVDKFVEAYRKAKNAS